MDSSCCLLIGGLRPMGSATSCFRLKQNDRDTPAAFERVLHVLPTGKRLQQTMGHHNFMAGKTHDFYYFQKKQLCNSHYQRGHSWISSPKTSPEDPAGADNGSPRPLLSLPSVDAPVFVM